MATIDHSMFIDVDTLPMPSQLTAANGAQGIKRSHRAAFGDSEFEYGGLRLMKLAGENAPQLAIAQLPLPLQQRRSASKSSLRRRNDVVHGEHSAAGTDAAETKKTVSFNDTVQNLMYWQHSIIGSYGRHDGLRTGAIHDVPFLKWQLQQSKKGAEKRGKRALRAGRGTVPTCVARICAQNSTDVGTIGQQSVSPSGSNVKLAKTAAAATSNAAPQDCASIVDGSHHLSLECLYQQALRDIDNIIAERLASLPTALSYDGFVAAGSLCDKLEDLRCQYRKTVTKRLQEAGGLHPNHSPDVKTPPVIDAEEDGYWTEVYMKAEARLRSCPLVKHVEEVEMGLELLRRRLERKLRPWIYVVEDPHHDMFTCSMEKGAVQHGFGIGMEVHC